MNRKKELERLRERVIHLESENDWLKTERMMLGSTVAKLKRELSESRMRYADVVERSRGIHIL